MCNMKLINTDKTIKESPCTSHLSKCTADKWIKLHSRNSWFYSCCNECKLRIFHSTGMELKSMTGNGILTLGQGCTVKGDTFTINSHTNFLSEIHMPGTTIMTPEISILNTVLNSTFGSDNLTFQPETHEIYTKLKTDLEQLKMDSVTQLSIHDVRHYAITYLVLIVMGLLTSIAGCYWQKHRQVPRTQESQPSSANVSDNATAIVITAAPPSHLPAPPHPCHRAASLDDKGRSPATPRRFRIPSL